MIKNKSLIAIILFSIVFPPQIALCSQNQGYLSYFKSMLGSGLQTGQQYVSSAASYVGSAISSAPQWFTQWIGSLNEKGKVAVLFAVTAALGIAIKVGYDRYGKVKEITTENQTVEKQPVKIMAEKPITTLRSIEAKMPTFKTPEETLKMYTINPSVLEIVDNFEQGNYGEEFANKVKQIKAYRPYYDLTEFNPFKNLLQDINQSIIRYSAENDTTQAMQEVVADTKNKISSLIKMVGPENQKRELIKEIIKDQDYADKIQIIQNIGLRSNNIKNHPWMNLLRSIDHIVFNEDNEYQGDKKPLAKKAIDLQIEMITLNPREYPTLPLQ